jgi:hypothetical protein
MVVINNFRLDQPRPSPLMTTQMMMRPSHQQEEAEAGEIGESNRNNKKGHIRTLSLGLVILDFST